jgi:hypothetical protein
MVVFGLPLMHQTEVSKALILPKPVDHKFVSIHKLIFHLGGWLRKKVIFLRPHPWRLEILAF